MLRGTGNHGNLSAIRWSPEASNWFAVIPTVGEHSWIRQARPLALSIRQGDNPLEAISGSRFVKLSRSHVAGEYVDEDVRGRAVLTINDDWIGLIDDLLIDMVDRRVCFLEVRTEGFPGAGEHRSLIPIEAMHVLDGQFVHVEHSSDHVSAAPIYNPHVIETMHYLNDVYEHYGYIPPWGLETEKT